MKILIFTHENNYNGGGSQALFEVVECLQQEYGAEIIVFTPQSGVLNQKFDEIDVLNYNVRYFWAVVNPIDGIIKNFVKRVRNFFCNYVAILKIEKMVNMELINLVYTNTSVIDIGARIATRNNKIHVWHIRELIEEHFGYKSFHRKYSEYIEKNAERIIAISKAIRNKYIEKGINSQKITLVYDGIDEKKYVNAIKEKNNTILRCVCVGHIYDLKGQFDIVKAIHALPENVKTRITVDFYGEYKKEYYLEIMQYIKKYNLSKNFRFLGFTDDIPAALQEYEVGFVCSKFEGFGRTTVEYMLSTICPIVSNTGANIELVEDGKNGLVYEYANVSDLSKKIAYAEKNREIVFELSIEAREKALKNYSLKSSVKALNRVFQECIGESTEAM